MADDPLESLRRLCLALPETTERLRHGEPTRSAASIKATVVVDQ
jgi:hypothetical protein